MKRLVIFQIALAVICALVLGYFGEQLVQGRADYVQAQRGAK